MRNLFIVICFAGVFVFLATCRSQGADKTGAIRGRISPKGVSVRIIAKFSGTEYRKKENIKGEVVLKKSGPFIIKNLPPGKYDLLFFLQGESKKKYMATRWSEIHVQAGKTTTGINYRLTPAGSPHLVDEVLVGFAGVAEEKARKILEKTGCTIKNRPLKLGKTTVYTVDIPDEKSVKQMIARLTKIKGVKYAEPNGICTINAN